MVTGVDITDMSMDVSIRTPKRHWKKNPIKTSDNQSENRILINKYFTNHHILPLISRGPG
jgi:hypothetical protein